MTGTRPSGERTRTLDKEPRTLSGLLSHLEEKGWQPGSSSNQNARIFYGPTDTDGKRISVVLPARATQPDAKRRILEVVETLAALESTTSEQIFNAIAPRVTAKPRTGTARSPRTLVGASNAALTD